MPVPAFTGAVYGSIFLSLFAIDYVLGNGFIDMFQTVFCKIVCVVKKTVREEARKAELKGPEAPVSLPVLLTEVLVLFVTVMFLNKYKQSQRKDRIDELLQESKDALKQTNEFLEKWRLRRINWQVPTEYSYLDEEPQEIKPLKLEVPILHMAIIDTLGTTRSQPERGDAGDTCNITDSTLLSVTSLIDDDLDSMTETHSDELVGETNSNRIEENRDFNTRIGEGRRSTLLSVTSLIDLDSMTETHSEELVGETNSNRIEENRDFNTRYLWDVMEEDANSVEDD